MKMQRTKGDPLPKLYVDMAERCAVHSSALMAAVRVGHVLAMLSSARALLGAGGGAGGADGEGRKGDGS